VGAATRVRGSTSGLCKARRRLRVGLEPSTIGQLAATTNHSASSPKAAAQTAIAGQRRYYSHTVVGLGGV